MYLVVNPIFGSFLTEASGQLHRPAERLPQQGEPAGQPPPVVGGDAGGQPVPVLAGRLHQGSGQTGGGRTGQGR